MVRRGWLDHDLGPEDRRGPRRIRRGVEGSGACGAERGPSTSLRELWYGLSKERDAWLDEAREALTASLSEP
jgi:hypothetical protein